MTAPVLGVVGTGLIGASIGLRARTNGWHVLGYDLSEAGVAEALACETIDAGVTRAELYARSDVVVLAPYLQATLLELEALRDAPPARAWLILDVASVKAPVMAASRGLPGFVGTHPMAGGERSGASAARAALFEERTWFYVPSPDADLDGRAAAFLAGFGATPVAIDAREHDRRVALTSHLPQICATLFAQRVNASLPPESADAACGPAARELRRLGRSPYAIWGEILRYNSANVEEETRAFARALLEAADALRAGDAAPLRAAFAAARGEQT